MEGESRQGLPFYCESVSPGSRYLNDVIGYVPNFVGPLGTGKTSLGQSIDRALGWPFQRIVLGGVRG